MTSQGTICALAAVLVLAACGGGEETSASPSQSASATTSRTPSPSPSPADTAAAEAEAASEDAITTIRLCQSMAPDSEKLLNAISAARNGTRTPQEIAATFREVQDSVEAMVAQVPERYPRLSTALQEYADTLGKARVDGSAGVTEIADAVENVNAACDAPAGG